MRYSLLLMNFFLFWVQIHEIYDFKLIEFEVNSELCGEKKNKAIEINLLLYDKRITWKLKYMNINSGIHRRYSKKNQTWWAHFGRKKNYKIFYKDFDKTHTKMCERQLFRIATATWKKNNLKTWSENERKANSNSNSNWYTNR